MARHNKSIRGEPSDDDREKLVNIGAYCLMPNHFHILVHEKSEGGISKFMLKLSTAYSMYFNKLNDRSGALFQGPFKAKHADNDEYLKYLFAYIHLNPLKIIDPNWRNYGAIDRSKAESYVKNYPYSSFGDYFKKEINSPTLQSTVFRTILMNHRSLKLIF